MRQKHKSRSKRQPRSARPIRLARGLLTLMIISTLGWADNRADGQQTSRKREVRVTGPGGRTIEREADFHRGAGSNSGRVSAQFPNASRSRSFESERSPGYRSRTFEAQRAIAPRGPRPPGTSVVVERHVSRHGHGPVIVNRPQRSSAANFAIGLGLGALGGAIVSSAARPAPPPPPVYLPSPPIIAVPGPPIAIPGPPIAVPVLPPHHSHNPPLGYGPPVVAGPPALSDEERAELQFRDAFGRLGSTHDNSRRDGAYTLGRLGDRRAVPSLIDLLRNDRDSDVRIAAARALGLLADPRAYGPLEQASRQDPKSKVRDTAAIVLQNWRLEEPEPSFHPAPSSHSPSSGSTYPSHSHPADIPPPPDLPTSRP